MNQKIRLLNLLIRDKRLRLLILLLTLSFSTVFLFIPDIEHQRYKPYTHEGKVIMIDTWALPLESGYKDFFLFSDQRLTLETHLFFLFEHLILVLLAINNWLTDRDFRVAAAVYLGIQTIDTLIYVLAYGHWGLQDSPIDWNIIKLLLFFMAILFEWKK